MMAPMTVRGLPRGLANDAWWMAADAQTGVGRGKSSAKQEPRPIWVLIALIVAVDLLILQVDWGLGFVALIVMLAGAVHGVMRGKVSTARATRAWCVLALSVLPAVDVVQFISVLIAWLGLTVFCAMMATPHWQAAIVRLPFVGLVQTSRDVRDAQFEKPAIRGLTDWVLPIGVGGVFVVLFLVANPLMSEFAETLAMPELPSIWRVIAWGIAAVVIWPVLRLSVMNLTAEPRKPKVGVAQISLINRRSILRALVVFNLLFAMQSAMDIGYLWGDVALPDGMTHATYAHRGAYPLMVAALMAGGFALIARPWLDGAMMRGLLLVWIVQTLLLVLSSILRLDLYVQAYSLTHLRFAAFVWMIVVVLGLLVLVMQILMDKSAGWMLSRSFGIGFLAVYACSLTNIAGYVARYQLTHGQVDAYYVCTLNEGAAVAVAELAPKLCDRKLAYWVDEPDDLREWGFRNARLRRSLGLIQSKEPPWASTF